jgi:carboxyl-terminal processing protease
MTTTQKRPIVMLALAAALLATPSPRARGEAAPDGARLLAEARALLLSDYYDQKLGKDRLDLAAVEGMMASLNGGKEHGPNQLLTPTELKDFTGDLKGEVVGIGVQIDFDQPSGTVQILGITPGSPAEAAGLVRGDRILAIDGASFRDRALPEVVRAIRGAEGSTVKISVLRGAAVTEKTIVRRAIKWSSVEQARWGDLGLVILRVFNERTPAELEASLKALGEAGIKRLVIDLRENGGGILDKALAVGELLLPQGAEFVRSVGRGGAVKHLVCRRGPVLRGVPIAVLVDAKTASSAELLAEALRVSAGATLVGGKTYGKWRAETIRPLQGGYALKFTVALMQSARGQNFDGVGLVPDLEVSAGSEPVDRARRQPDLAKRMEVDPQLKAAVHVLRLRG